MFNERRLKAWTSLMLVILLTAFLAGCAAKKPFWGDVKTGLILQYQMSKDQALKYQFSSKMTQNLEMMGQSMENIINSDIMFSAKPIGLEKGNHQLEITIDSMAADIRTPQGNPSPDLSSVFGKSFKMSLTPLGKELDLSGAEEIKVNMGSGGDRSIASNFQTIFPDLAGKPVKVGDSWTVNDTVNVKESGTDMRMTFVSMNTLQGFETVDGYECVKVTGKSIGILDGKGEQMGANLLFEGDIESKDTWYFAYKTGTLIKSISDGLTEGNIVVTGAQEMTIPMTMEMKMETTLMK